MASLTNEQVENWRQMLSVSVGPLALRLRPWEIEMVRDLMQAAFDQDSNTYHEDRASVTVAEDRARKAREASMKAREDRLASLSQRIADALDE